MQQIRSWFESYFGLPDAGPAEGSRWDLVSAPPWEGWCPGWAAWVMAGMVLCAIVWVYLRDAQRLRTSTRIRLLALRVSAFLLAWFIVLRPSLLVTRTGSPIVVLLIDTSGSMEFEDSYRDAETARFVKQLFAGDDSTRPHRLNLVKALLSRRGADLPRSLLERFRVVTFRFDGSAGRFGKDVSLLPADAEEMASALKRLKPEGTASRPAHAVREVLRSLRGESVAAIVLLTDGISSQGKSESLSTVASFSAERGVPLFPVVVGGEEPARDLRLSEPRLDEIVMADDRVLFRAAFAAFGFEGETVDVVLKRKGSPAVIASRRIRVDASSVRRPIDLVFTPKNTGRFEYELSLTAMPGESDTTNNAVTASVSVRREKMKVLLVDTVVRYEFRYIKERLLRDRNVVVHTVLVDADESAANQDATSKPLGGRVPDSIDALKTYDAILWGDVDPSRVEAGTFSRLSEYVSKHGGGLVMIAGRFFNPHEYQPQELQKLLPVQFAGGKINTTSQALQARATPVAQHSSLFLFAESTERNRELWKQFPTLRWAVLPNAVHPASTVWVTGSRDDQQAGDVPLIVSMGRGRGTVFWHGSDDLWQWRHLSGDATHGRYYGQLVRFLTLARIRSRTQSAVLETTRRQFSRGDTVPLLLRLFERPGDSLREAHVTVTGPSGFETTVVLKPIADQPNLFRGELTAAVTGTYRAVLKSPSFEKTVPATTFAVIPPRAEQRVRVPDVADLGLAARLSKGKRLALHETESLADELPAGEPVPLGDDARIALWSRWELLILLTALLSVEWLVRRRSLLV